MENIKKIEIEVNDTSPFYYGQKVYLVNADYSHQMVFRSRCPICGGENKLTVKGFSFDCPYCRKTNIYGVLDSMNMLRLDNYEIEDYIINEMTIRGYDDKSDYTASKKEKVHPKVYWEGFHKKRTQYSVKRRSFNEADLSGKNVMCFLSKSDAQKKLKNLHEQQKEKLREFNERNGTNHEYPFEY